MKLASVFACLAAVALTGACYDPDGENYVPVIPPDASEIILDLEGAADTIFIDAETHFQIIYQGKPTLLAFEVFVNGRSVLNQEPNYYGEAGFYLSPRVQGTGVYPLEIRILTKSNSGSLLDKLDAERVLFSRKFVLVSEAEEPAPREVSYAVTDGALTLSWQPYTKWNFEAYIVSRNCGPYDTDCKTFRITDPNQTTWEDETYFGQSVSYRVNLVTRSTTLQGLLSYYYYAPTLAIHNATDETIDVRWTKPSFHKHTRAMRLYQGTTLLRETSNLSDTSLTTPNNFHFGATYTRAFALEWEGDSGAKYRVDIPFARGRQVVAGGVGDGVYNEALQSYVLVTNRSGLGYIDRYAQDFTLQASNSAQASSKFTLSPNGKWLWTFPGVEAAAYRLDPATLALAESYTPLYSGTLQPTKNISNTNWLAYHTYNGGQANLLRDMNTRKVILSAGVGSVIEGAFISPNTMYYFYESYKVCEVRNDKLYLLGTITSAIGANLVQFLDDNTLMIVKQGKIRLVSVPALTEQVIDMGTTAISNLRYDAPSDQLYWTASGEVRMMNIVTGEKRRVPLAPGAWAPLLANGHLISMDGYMIDSDYIKSLNP